MTQYACGHMRASAYLVYQISELYVHQCWHCNALGIIHFIHMDLSVLGYSVVQSAGVLAGGRV